MKKSNYQNILIVRTDRIGDVVLTTPTIHALRQALPQARLSILVAPATQDLVKGNPDLNQILLDDRRAMHQGLGGFLKLVNEIRRERFDAAIILHTKKRTNLLCFLAGIPLRIGYQNAKWGFLLNHPIEDTRHHGTKHEADYCLDVLKALGLNIKPHPLTLFVPVQPSAEQWAQQIFQQQGFSPTDKIFALHPGASDPSKQWPAKRFVELVEALSGRYAGRFILVGADNVKPIAQTICSSTKVPILNLAGQTTVSQMASLFKRCTMLISNDSGPVHVAAGVGTPVVSIFTRNQPGINAQRWKPLGSKSRFITVPLDNTLSFAKAGPHDPKYLELIQTHEVLEEVDALFKLC
jgi:lipopolysaccharide heptosyltransferase II